MALRAAQKTRPNTEIFQVGPVVKPQCDTAPEMTPRSLEAWRAEHGDVAASVHSWLGLRLVLERSAGR